MHRETCRCAVPAVVCAKPARFVVPRMSWGTCFMPRETCRCAVPAVVHAKPAVPAHLQCCLRLQAAAISRQASHVHLWEQKPLFVCAAAEMCHASFIRAIACCLLSSRHRMRSSTTCARATTAPPGDTSSTCACKVGGCMGGWVALAVFLGACMVATAPLGSNLLSRHHCWLCFIASIA